MPLFKKNQRYKVSSRSDYIQLVILLDGSQMECNLPTDCNASDCLENVLQRLEVVEVMIFGLKYITQTGDFRWLDADKSLKKQLEKNAKSNAVYLGIQCYVDRAYALKDDSTRYQYYLQLKSDVLYSRIRCSLEKAVLLAGYVLQAEYQNHEDARQSEEYLKELEKLDSTLLPQSLVSKYEGTSALSDIAHHIVTSHNTLSGLSSTQAEISYIHLAQQVDGTNIEHTKTTDSTGEEVFLCSSQFSIFTRKPDGQIKQDFNRLQITDITSQKKSLFISKTDKKETGKFLMASVDLARYLQRIFLLQQEFYTADYSYMLYSDEELAVGRENGVTDSMINYSYAPHQPTGQYAVQHEDEHNLPMEGSYILPVGIQYDGHVSEEADLIDNRVITGNDTADIQPTISNQELPTSDFRDSEDNDYATLKFHNDRPRAYTTSAYTTSAYSDAKTGASFDELHKNNFLHRSVTALQDYRDATELPYRSTTVLDNPSSYSLQNLNNLNEIISSSQINVASYSGELIPTREFASLDLPSYRPTPDYATVMKERRMFNDPPPVLPNSSNSVNALDPRLLYTQYAPMSASQPDLCDKEPLYANLLEHQINQAGAKHKSELHIQNLHLLNALGDNSKSPAHHNVVYPVAPPATTAPPILLPNKLGPTPDLMNDIHVHNTGQAPDITSQTGVSSAHVTKNPDLIAGGIVEHLDTTTHQNPYKSFENLTQLALNEDKHSVHSNQSSSHADNSRDNSCNSSIIAPAMPSSAHQDHQLQNKTAVSASRDERVTLLEEKLNSDSIAAEYDTILKKRQPADCRVALHPENASRNRFPSMIPYEDSRVRLIPNAVNPHGYINANHINMMVGQEKLTYIATQNPLDDTVGDFWQMVWHHNVNIIVMLTELEERSTQKCPKYWPNSPGLSNAINVTELRVVLKHSTVSSNFMTSCFRVYKNKSRGYRTIWHIQYTDWSPHGGCPKDVHGFLDLLNEINSVRLHIQSETGAFSPCVLVHCSTGVGRSGVVILSDVMRKCLDNNQEISVAGSLKDLRQQRMYMVQTLAQYKFVHEVLIHYLKGVRLI